MTETYQGYKNRSTWLAKLHLDNTSLEVYEDFEKLKNKYNEMVEYWEDLQKRDHLSYSYPFHQHKAVETGLKNLLRRTKIDTELNFHFREIDYKELFA